MEATSTWLVRIGVAGLAPVLLAASCDEAALDPSHRPDFGGPVGRQAVASVRIVNTGVRDATLGDVSSSALGLTAPFSLVGGTCVKGRVIPKSRGGDCTLEIGFNAQQAKRYSGKISLSYTSAEISEPKTLNFDVYGTATLPLEITPSWIAFQAVGLDSVNEAVVTLRNRGGYPITLGDVSRVAFDLQAPFYGVGGSCQSNGVIAPDGACTIGVRFAPETVDRFFDVLAFTYDWPGSGGPAETRIGVEGSSAVPVSLAASPLLLPGVPAGGSTKQTLTLTNAGGQVAVLGTLNDASLGLAPPFSLAGGTCASGLAIPPYGGSCTLEVVFTPTTPGAANDLLTVRYGWSGVANAFSVEHSLNGTAIAPNGTNCYETGCAEGQICTQLSSTSDASGTCLTVPDPPPGCMAPCVWEARQKCLPVLGACTAKVVQTPGEFSIETKDVCDAKTGWTVHEERLFGSLPVDTRIGRDASICYAARARAYGPPFDFVHENGSGPIALTAIETVPQIARRTWCGSYTSSTGLDPQEAIVERFDDPACIAWHRTYLDWTQCRSETPGSCVGL